MRRIALALACLALFAHPARAEVLATALEDAFMSFERALPRLAATEFGVDVAAYRDALTLHRFQSAHWGGTVVLDVVVQPSADGSCNRFAAFVPLPPQNGSVSLVLCPQFTETGTPALRRLTVLHEMVHVVAGPDECRAMAFAARIETLAIGNHTPVDRYWSANNCETSGFRLP